MFGKAFLLLLILLLHVGCGKKADEKPSWAKKDIRDFDEADLERLYEQWEEDEEPLAEDELPEHLRKGPELDFSKIDMSDPEALVRMSKKGKTVMAFVAVDPAVPKDQVETVTQLWQTGLWNNHIQAERYSVDEHRVIFLFKDGSHAWEAKDYLTKQADCVNIVIEGKTYNGPAYKEGMVQEGNEGKTEL